MHPLCVSLRCLCYPQADKLPSESRPRSYFGSFKLLARGAFFDSNALTECSYVRLMSIGISRWPPLLANGVCPFHMVRSLPPPTPSPYSSVLMHAYLREPQGYLFCWTITVLITVHRL